MQYPALDSTLHNAVMKGDQTQTSAALEDKTQLEERSRSMTPLQSAAHLGHYELLTLLISGGANVNAAPSEFGCAIQATITSLWFKNMPDAMGLKMDGHMQKKKAAQKEAVSYLLDHDANPNAFGGEFGSPLAAAAAFGDTDIVELLLKRGASPDSPGGRFGYALQAACSRGGMPVEWCVSPAKSEDYTKVQTMLLQAGSHLNSVGGIYGTALQAAAFLDDTSTVSRLLVEGADPNIRAGKYGSALGAAASQGHRKVAEILLEAGHSTDAGNVINPSDDWSKWRLEPISSLLLKHTAPLPSSTIPLEERSASVIESPTDLAYRNGHFDVVRMLPN